MSIKELLDQIKELYPDERVAKSKERFLKIWNMESPDDPPLLAQSWMSLFWPSDAVDDRTYYEPERRLRFQLEGIVARGIIKDDFIPSLFPDERISVVPSAFGCKVDDKPGEHQWVHPLINKPEDVYSIKKPEIGISGMSKHVFDMIRYSREATDDAVPTRPSDVQGPMGAASLVMGYQEFLMALYTNPKEVHYLLEMVTEVIIDYYHKLFDVSGGNFVPTHVVPMMWLPPGKGVAVSDDLMPIVSPEHYLEFSAPYSEKIAKEFGGIFMHSCGDASSSIDAMVSTKGLTGLHLGQMSIKKLAPLVRGRVPIVPACQPGMGDWNLVGEKNVRAAIEICREGTYAVLVVGNGGEIASEAELINRIRKQ
jgi:Uroporphyrinogen decarboxylase (URO-D)